MNDVIKHALMGAGVAVGLGMIGVGGYIFINSGKKAKK